MARLSFDKSDLHHRRFRVQGVSGVVGLGLVGLCAIGCDSLSFTPPRPPELSRESSTSPVRSARPGAEAAAPLGMKSIELVLSPRSVEDVEYLKTAARTQAGLDKVRVQVAEAPQGGPGSPSPQAEAVRKAAALGPVAILIEAPASPDPELSKAAAEARGRGVLVIALGRSLGEAQAEAESGETGRMIVVVPESFKASSAVLVADAVRNAENGKLAPKEGAVILINTACDPLVEDRVAALREALKEAGVAEVEEVRFGGDGDEGQNKLVEHLKAHPKAAMVFGTDYVSVTIADKATGVLKTDHPYVIAGYSADEAHGRTQTQMGEFAAIGAYSPDRLIRKGVSVAAAIQRGTNVPDQVEVKVTILESGVSAALPRMHVDDEHTDHAPSEKSQSKDESKD